MKSKTVAYFDLLMVACKTCRRSVMNTKLTRPNGHEGDTMERLTPIGTAATALFRSVREPMKHLATVALIFNLGVAPAYAQDDSVKMTFSGNGAPSAMDLKQPNSNKIEENVAGNGTLGSFTFRDIRAAAMFPQPSTTCSATFFPA